eukprot:GFYU01001397.1.p1 GENE.GFYU01001397.1~~GFYU01001397.1.p1  ORF type:complete len:261 (-),score=36.40 GFYU01001397.1:221-1003(-)
MATSLEEWFRQVPVVTRTYLVISFLTTIACALDLVSPFTLYFNWKLIMAGEVWRLFTNFFFFGMFGIDFVFHMFFLGRYCRLLEEGSFRGRTSDFVYMLTLGSLMMIAVAPFVSLHFLGLSMTFMMAYIWGRRNANVRMSFIGLFHFAAPYLAWVLLIFSLLLGNSPVVDLIGMTVGHIYYYLEDVYPIMSGRRLLPTPKIFKMMFDPADTVQYIGADIPAAGEGDDTDDGGFTDTADAPPNNYGNVEADAMAQEHPHQD